ncbi:hypothetical protein [Microbacterium sp. UBA3486]|uniref:hypothetical protein n=1 Tax=Microbacterium TaxID=33882 RepID=UPI0025FA4F86|nr:MULTISPECIES: hypothetical protein [Microbacterium]
MSEKHRDPEWRKTCRIIRQQVRLAWARGDDVTCWRHGHIIPEGQPYDVGHITLHGGNGIDNAAPECRHGNRSHGGRIGAKLTNARRQAKTSGVVKPAWA